MMRFLVSLLLCLIVQPAIAQPKFDLGAMGALPVMHEGRIKPLASFAQIHYRQLRDVAYASDEDALAFLAQALFDPAQSAEEKRITIRDPSLRQWLNLDPRAQHFALTDLVKPLARHEKNLVEWLEKDPKTLQPQEKTMLALYDKIAGYTQILRGFTMLLPLDVTLPAALHNKYDVSGEALNYFSLLGQEQTITSALQEVIKRKGKDIKNYTADEQNLAALSYQMDQIRLNGQGNVLLRVIPDTWQGAVLLSPWQSLLSGQASPQSQEALGHWRDMAMAFRTQDMAGFNLAAQRIETMMRANPDISVVKLQLEQFYTKAHLSFVSLLLYGFALVLLALRQTSGARMAAILGLIAHAGAIILRIAILSRPPVTTLYESILFVGFVAVLGLIVTATHSRQALYTGLASFLGASLQIVAMGFAQGGDTLQVLQAVLNTPFWLAVHVIVITAGYGACLVTSLLAQASFIVRTKINDGALWVGASIALLLTTTGTILGGLWADQSWGRFWGWDPKENGALLITLWIIWAMHARLSAHLNDAQYRAALGMLSVIVAIAWFGVNMLGTGLHSYGFTSGIAAGLGAFVVVQTGVIAVLYMRARKAADAS